MREYSRYILDERLFRRGIFATVPCSDHSRGDWSIDGVPAGGFQIVRKDEIDKDPAERENPWRRR